MLVNENELTPSWFKVTDVPELYSKVAIAEDDVWFRAEIFKLDKATVVAWLVLHEGAAFVTPTGDVYVSGSTIIAMAEADESPQVEAIRAMVVKLYNQGIEIEILRESTRNETIIH